MTLHHYGGYVSVDWEVDGEDVEPLLWCLRFAIGSYHPLDYWLRRILPSTEGHYAGGDPGWEITNVDLRTGELLRDANGVVRYRAWTDEDMSYMTPCEGEYDEAVVKRLARRALENLRQAEPERSDEVDAVVAKYDL